MSFRALSNFLVIHCVLSLPDVVFSLLARCAPAISTTRVVITYESLITISHSCYSYTTQTPAHVGCPVYKCPGGAAPDCIVISTTTSFVPPKDPCCETTPTKTIFGPCSTCQTGCKTEVVVATVTTTGSSGVAVDPTPGTPSTLTVPPLLRAVKKDPQSFVLGEPCTTTILRGDPWELGPTKTAYLWTETVTSSTSCGGCEYIVEGNLNGLGPAIVYTATYNDPLPTTTTAYVCAKL